MIIVVRLIVTFIQNSENLYCPGQMWSTYMLVVEKWNVIKYNTHCSQAS